MGVVNLHLQNKALLLRCLWRLYEVDRKLWAAYAVMIYARPIPDGPLIFSSAGSFFWMSLIKLRPIFLSATRIQIRSGRNVSFWFDNWNGQSIAGSLVRHLPRSLPNRDISVFHAKQSLHSLLPRPFTFGIDQAIQCLEQFTPVPGRDELTWSLSASGQFSVKSIYSILSQGGKVRSATVSLWKAKVTPSMKIFFLLFLNNRLLTQEVLQRRNIGYQLGCVMCDNLVNEDAKHLFFSCSYAQQIWSILSAQMGCAMVVVEESITQLYLNSTPLDRDRRQTWRTLFITTVWLIWKERNERIFRDRRSPVTVLANRIRQEAHLYSQHC